MKYEHYVIKRKIENIFIFPFLLIGKLIALLKPSKKEYKIFFFFPYYHTGGAEKVHALITQAIGNKECIIFFTKKSTDATFYAAFEKSNCSIKNISPFTDNKWLYFFNLIYRGIITAFINNQSNYPIVFNGQCNFGYKISPWIKKEIKQIELIHSFNTFSWIRVPFIEFIDHTVMISKVRINNHLEQYEQLNVPSQFKNNIQYIGNGIELPKNKIDKNYNTPLNVLYVGRGTMEKRVHLFAAIAKQVKEKNDTLHFTIIGNIENSVPNSLLQYCLLQGNIDDASQLAKLYAQAHILLITSNTEGFPMVVMEAMAYGCAIIATPVGDLPIHVKNSIHGFVTSSINEDVVIDEMTKQIMALNTNRDLLTSIGLKNQQYAKENFDIAVFNKNYQMLLNN